MPAEWDQDAAPKTELPLGKRTHELPSRLKLVVLSGPDQGASLLLPHGRHTVGKAATCALVLTDGAVSRQHLDLEVGPDGVVARDLDSSNGSFYQGARFREVTVGAGAVIVVGDSELKLVSADQHSALPPSAADRFGGLLGSSLRMRELFAVLERVAPTDAAVLLEGETGTGKELAAEGIHQASRRASGPFVVCDLAALTTTLIESELFGHRRGAFTGADQDREGAFAQAHGGTLFIDEVGELELAAQPRLLRALESHKIKPVGASDYRAVDVRVVAATHRDLLEEVRAGRFREDLYHRLAVVRVPLPPLRERKPDLPRLVEHLLEGTGVTVPPETHALLAEYDWPGNVRELRNVLERGRSLLGDHTVLAPSLLGLDATPDAAHPAEGYHESKERLLADWEMAFVTDLLRRAGGNVSRAARAGGLDRAYLHRLMKKHRIGEGS